MLARSNMLQSLLSQCSSLQQAGVLLQAVHNCSSAVPCLHSAAVQSQPQHTAAPCSNAQPAGVLELPHSQETATNYNCSQQPAGSPHGPALHGLPFAAGWHVCQPDSDDCISQGSGKNDRSSSCSSSSSRMQLQKDCWPRHSQGHLQLQQVKRAFQQARTTMQWTYGCQQPIGKHSARLRHTTTSSSIADASGPTTPSSSQPAPAPASAASNRAEALSGDAFEDEGEVLLDEFEVLDEAAAAAGGVVDSEWTNEGAVSTSQHNADYADSADEYDVEFDEDFDFEDEEGLQDCLPAQESSKSV